MSFEVTRMDTETQLLTIAETARELKVSVVTLHRWLKKGRLRAYRLGPRAVRIRRSDLNELLAPVSPKGGLVVPAASKAYGKLEDIPRLTEEDKKRQLEAMDAARAFREELAAARGGKPFPPSWPMIRKAREERSKQLGRQDASRR